MIEHYWHTLPGQMWFSATHIFREQVQQGANGAVFVELGAWKGRSAAFMGVEIANSNKQITFYSIDHWLGSNGEKAHRTDDDVKLNRLYEVFLENTSPVRDFIRHLRSDSAEAAAQFEDLSVDFIYVDAGHTYSAAMKDITAWWPKLKSGGVMAGDDWCFFDGKEFSVRRAVEEFFTPRRTKIFIRPGEPNPEWEQWLVHKTAGMSAEYVTFDRGIFVSDNSKMYPSQWKNDATPAGCGSRLSAAFKRSYELLCGLTQSRPRWRDRARGRHRLDPSHIQ